MLRAALLLALAACCTGFHASPHLAQSRPAPVAAALRAQTVAFAVDGTSVALTLDAATSLLAVAANELEAWQLAIPFEADGTLNGQMLGRDLILFYIYAHVPAFGYLGWFYSRNGSLRNAWPPRFD